MGYYDISNDCFACQWVLEDGLECSQCPISSKCGACYLSNSCFEMLKETIRYHNQYEAVRLAEIIRDAWE